MSESRAREARRRGEERTMNFEQDVVELCERNENAAASASREGRRGRERGIKSELTFNDLCIQSAETDVNESISSSILFLLSLAHTHPS